VSSKKADLDKRLDAIIGKCLKQQPADRYQSVGELIRDLEPLVPVSSMIFTTHTSPAQRVLRKAKEIGRKTARGAEAAVVLFALAVVGVALLRDRAKSNEQPAGIQLTTETGGKWPVTATGRVDHDTQTLTLGTGPDSVPINAYGRHATVENGTITFGPPTDSRVGRAELDIELKGDGLEFIALATTQEIKHSWFDPIRALFVGPRPNARSALMLTGATGRYVALIIPGDGNTPPMLEWALGEKRGSMSSPLTNAGAETQLELKIDPATGELAALVGKGRDQRLLGDSVTLGPGWRSLFGDPPHAAVGCLEGLCSFSGLQEHTLELPPPPTPKVEIPVSTEEPPEPHHTTIAQAHNPPPHNAPPPKPPVHTTAPPPAGKKQPPPPPQGKKK